MVKNMQDVYLYRKDRRWQKFSKIDEIILTGVQAVYQGVTGSNSSDQLTIASNRLFNGDAVYFQAITGGSALAVNVTYYVINKSGNFFQLASTVGGSALNLGSDITAGTLVQTQPEMNIWSSEYRDLFDVDTALYSAPGSLTVTQPAPFSGQVLTINSVNSEKLQFKATLIPTEPLTQQTVSGTYSQSSSSRSYGTNVSVVPTGVTSTTSDEVSHANLRQSVLKKTHWRFRQANSATPTYLYATWADGDQISNEPPETV
jgi:hypothetical protein